MLRPPASNERLLLSREKWVGQGEPANQVITDLHRFNQSVAGVVVLVLSVVLLFLAYRLRKQGSGLVDMAESLE